MNILFNTTAPSPGGSSSSSSRSGLHLLMTSAPPLIFSSSFYAPLLILIILAVSATSTFTYPFLFKRREKAVRDSSVLGKPGDPDFHEALYTGYKKYKDSTFTVPTAHHSMVIIPHKFVEEIKALPEDQLTFKKQVSERFLGRYTGLGITDTLVHSVKVGRYLTLATAVEKGWKLPKTGEVLGLFCPKSAALPPFSVLPLTPTHGTLKLASTDIPARATLTANATFRPSM